MTNIENAKKKLDEFVAHGGDVASLKRSDKLYRYIKDLRWVDENGVRIPLEEKFTLLGHDRAPKLVGDPLSRITEKFNRFLDEGGNVDDIVFGHPLYTEIKNASIKGKDGKKLTMQEKFALLGVDREPVYAKDVKAELVKEIEEYRKAGGSFHVSRKQLPFYPRLATYCRSLTRKGIKVTTEQAMKDLGFREYSDIYYRFMGLKKLSSYRDENGFVDSYRQDEQMRQYINAAAKTLDMPIALVIMLVCNEKLGASYFDTDYFKFVKTDLENYIDVYGSLKGISNNDPVVYGRLTTIKKYLSLDMGLSASTADILFLLDIPDVDHKFSTESFTNQSMEEELNKLCLLAGKQDGVLHKSDIPDEQYRHIVLQSIKLGITTKSLFKAYDIDYVDGRDVKRLSKVRVEGFPYVDQMRQRRDALLDSKGVCLANGYSEEEIFEATIEASLQAYKEYKTKIFNFTEDAIEDIVKEGEKDKK